MVDFMSKIRQMPLAQFPTLGAVINAIISSISSLCQEPEFIHLVLDSYIEMSLKEGERMRRTDSTTGIDIIAMNRDTPIPQQLDKFWGEQAEFSTVVIYDEVLPAKAAGGKEIPDRIIIGLKHIS